MCILTLFIIIGQQWDQKESTREVWERNWRYCQPWQRDYNFKQKSRGSAVSKSADSQEGARDAGVWGLLEKSKRR